MGYLAYKRLKESVSRPYYTRKYQKARAKPAMGVSVLILKTSWRGALIRTTILGYTGESRNNRTPLEE